MQQNLLVGGAIGGVLIGFWNQAKILLGKLLGVFVVRIQVNGRQLHEAVSRMLVTEFKCSPLGKKHFGGSIEYVRPKSRTLLVAMEGIPLEPTIWWRNGLPMVVSLNNDTLLISFLRWTYDHDKFLLEAVDKFNDGNDGNDWRSRDRFYVRRKTGSIGRQHDKRELSKENAAPAIADTTCGSGDKLTSRPLRWSRDDLGMPKPASPMDLLWLADDAKDAVEEAVRWRNSEQWFKARNVPWKRGWVLHGPPGTGKTAFVRALGQELNMPIMNFDLPTMTNQDFTDAWDDVMSHVPCVALFEDFDAVFDGRKNVASKGFDNGVSFDCILNQMDGVENTDGVFIIVTTNDISKIDPAIAAAEQDGDSSRPGRIDRSILFGMLPDDGKAKIAKRILGDFPQEKWDHLLSDSKPLTGAQFQYRCSRLAMKLFWGSGSGFDQQQGGKQ